METTTNRKCLKFVYTSELYHHGIMGMSWGERNGPPYPLGGIDKKISRIEAKRKIAREKALEKARKAAKAKRKAEAKDRKREERAAAQAEKDQLRKAKLLARGDLKDIYRNRELFTTQELNDAVNRSRILDQAKKDKRNKALERRQQKLEDEAYRRARKEQKEAEKNKSKKTMTPEELEKTWEDRLKKVANMATSVGTIANSATSVVKLIEEIAAGARRSDIHVKDLELKDLEISKRKKDSISMPDIGNVKEPKKSGKTEAPKTESVKSKKDNRDTPSGQKLKDIISGFKDGEFSKPLESFIVGGGSSKSSGMDASKDFVKKKSDTIIVDAIFEDTPSWTSRGSGTISRGLGMISGDDSKKKAVRNDGPSGGGSSRDGGSSGKTKKSSGSESGVSAAIRQFFEREVNPTYDKTTGKGKGLASPIAQDVMTTPIWSIGSDATRWDEIQEWTRKSVGLGNGHELRSFEPADHLKGYRPWMK